MAHQAFSLVALAPLMATKVSYYRQVCAVLALSHNKSIILSSDAALQAYREQHTPTISKQWLGLIGIAAFFAFNLG